MMPRALSGFILSLLFTSLFGQERFSGYKDLRGEWLAFDGTEYHRVDDLPFGGLNTIYFQLDPRQHAGEYLKVSSYKPYFLFVNGKVRGEFTDVTHFRIDSLLQHENRASWIAIHQQKINDRDLMTGILSMGTAESPGEAAMAMRPYDPFRDFVVIAGLVIILSFLAAFRLNPKLASDYFSVSRIFASREIEEGQASARLTGGANVLFYVLCSLMIGYYLLIVFRNLPVRYELALRFEARGFLGIVWQWIQLSAVVFIVLLAKVLIIFALTRLFDMRGMARFHFFNWIRLLLVVIGTATSILFMYFISRGSGPAYYVFFLSVIIIVLAAWIVVAFFKLSGRTGHSMFHLFSYLCATEIIPLLVTVKVLFQ